MIHTGISGTFRDSAKAFELLKGAGVYDAAPASPESEAARMAVIREVLQRLQEESDREDEYERGRHQHGYSV